MTSFATTSTGTRIAYFEAGRPWRPALILAHSLGSDHQMWAPQVEALKSQYSLIAIDNIGHGDSSVPAGDYTVADFAEAVIAVADAAELERFHYCGLSVGGITGLLVAAQHPDRLLSLTLCNTGATIGSSEPLAGLMGHDPCSAAPCSRPPGARRVPLLDPACNLTPRQA